MLKKKARWKGQKNPTPQTWMSLSQWILDSPVLFGPQRQDYRGTAELWRHRPHIRPAKDAFTVFQPQPYYTTLLSNPRRQRCLNCELPVLWKHTDPGEKFVSSWLYRICGAQTLTNLLSNLCLSLFYTCKDECRKHSGCSFSFKASKSCVRRLKWQTQLLANSISCS